MKTDALAWLAKQFIGVNDKSLSLVNRFRKAVDGKASGEPWCVCFAQHLVREIDALFVEMKLAAAQPHTLCATESTQELWKHAVTKQATPTVGALVVWRSLADPTRGHLGIVIAVGKDGIMTVEGNTSEPGAESDESNGRGVWRKTRFGGAIPGFELLGYLSPWA